MTDLVDCRALAFDEGHHHAGDVEAIVAVGQTLLAGVEMSLAQQGAAFVQQVVAEDRHKLRVRLNAKDMLVDSESSYRAKLAAGEQGGAWGQLKDLVLVAGQQGYF